MPATGRLRQHLRERRGAHLPAFGGRRAPLQDGERPGPEQALLSEHVGVLGEVGVEHADELRLHGRLLLLELLAVAGEHLERLDLVGGEPGDVEVAHAQHLGDEPAVDAVVLHARHALEPAHGLDLHGVDHGDFVPAGHEVGEAGHPVVAGGFHADEDLAGVLGDALEPGDAPLEARLGVLEAHRLRDLVALVVDGVDDVVHLGDVHTRVDHGCAPSLLGMHGGTFCPTTQDRSLLKEIRSEAGRARPPPSS